MNELISKLKQQAGIDYNPDQEGLDLFAELIIRECMDLLEDYTTDINVGGIQYTVVGASETLQEHFGVEE